MSDALTPPPPPPPPPPRPRRGALFGAVFTVSILFNLLFVVLTVLAVVGALWLNSAGDGSDERPTERYHSGKKSASAKVAVVRIEGVILEGMTGFAQRQIEEAAHDNDVKAVVLRINSPGGSITASDDLHHRLIELRDGNPDKKTEAKPLVVSMSGLAASGGYYIAMPASTLFAERTTLTGSIGVYAAFPNVTGLSDKIGVTMEVIKQGEVKDSGSPFHHMTAQERQVWQDMVDHAYGQFLAVVEQGRPQLKGKLREVIIHKTIPADDKAPGKQVPYERRRADGGIFTADQAKEFGLIDQVGYLDDAVDAARKAAGLSEDYKAVIYERPQGLLGGLLGIQTAPQPAAQLDPGRLATAITPRLWYLAPQAEVAGLLTAAGR